MASTREERRQMRQRGAGTREIKKVDFGFSFGGQALGPPEPAELANVPEPAGQPPTQPAPTSTPRVSQTSPKTDSRGKGRAPHTPGSARNQLPQRPSTYDIPSDDGPAESRSNKRRRISTPLTKLLPLKRGTDTGKDAPQTKSPRSKARDSQRSDSTPVRNGDTNAPADRPAEATVTDAAQATAANNPPRTQSLPESSTYEQISTSRDLGANGAGADPSTRSEEQAQPRPQVPEPETTAAPGSIDTESTQGQSPKASPLETEPTGEDQPETTSKRQRKSPSSRRTERTRKETTEHNANGAARVSRLPTAHNGTKPQTKDGRRRGGSANASGLDQEPVIENTDNSHLQTAEEVASEIENQTRRERASTQPNAAKPKRPRGRPSLARKVAEAGAEDQRENAVGSANTTGESSATGAHRGRKRKAESRPNSGPEPEETQEPEPEPEGEAEVAAPKSRRGRPAKKAKRTAEREPSPTEEQPDTETTRQTRRKPREPRGETVPVTVYRLANASALGADANGSGEEEEESADELSTRRRTKLPNRGGVNPADVLSQICRETLEKTLTTLKNGIANEKNSTQRAEWTRKRKAVEAFSSELDGRLLDLSEMLDSNFVLGVQLKKAKRQMMDQRSHLYKVRRERESVALQMDAVRAKHMEEENAQTARATVNNSLHSLELALDRSQRAPSSTEPSSADLEFMLRAVADDVSSRAPGSQGGLLQQIRAFNAQLESTARRLEGK